MWLSPPRVGDLTADDPHRVGAYRLLGRLGQGGMGTVYLGEGAKGSRVAVKVVKPEFAGDAEFRDRFRREVRAARRVARFCTAQVLDADLDGSLLFMVTEYVEGPNLHQFVRQLGPISGSALEALAVGVATALAAIHQAGLVHRDLKPGNVLLSALGPRVIDFGIAKALDTLGPLTRTGSTLGTPSYMAPEQVTGEPATTATDVFAWGGVIAFAGTGRPPFGAGADPSVLYRIVHQEPGLDGLDERLRPLVAQALAKEPERRPSAQALLDGLLGRTEVSGSAAASAAERSWSAPDEAAPTERVHVPDPPSGPARVEAATTGPAADPRAATSPTGGKTPIATELAAAVATAFAGRSATTRGDRAASEATTAPAVPEAVAGVGAARPRRRVRRAVSLALGSVLVLGAAGAVWLLARGSATGDVPSTSELERVLQSGFSDASQGWEQAPWATIADGRYRLHWGIGYGPTAEIVAPAEIPDDVLMRVKVKVPPEGRLTDYGMWCYGQNYGRQYKLQVSPDRIGLIDKVTEPPGRVFQEIQHPTNARIGLGSEHELAAACQRRDGGVWVRLWVDGKLVAEALDANDPLQPGDAGIYAGLRDDRGTTVDVSFDDFAMYRLPPDS